MKITKILKNLMPAMRCNEVVISIALVLRREAAETEQMSHRGHSPVALRERRTMGVRYDDDNR